MHLRLGYIKIIIDIRARQMSNLPDGSFSIWLACRGHFHIDAFWVLTPPPPADYSPFSQRRRVHANILVFPFLDKCNTSEKVLNQTYITLPIHTAKYTSQPLNTNLKFVSKIILPRRVSVLFR